MQSGAGCRGEPGVAKEEGEVGLHLDATPASGARSLPGDFGVVVFNPAWLREKQERGQRAPAKLVACVGGAAMAPRAAFALAACTAGPPEGPPLSRDTVPQGWTRSPGCSWLPEPGSGPTGEAGVCGT